MNLTRLADFDLLASTKTASSREKAATLDLLEHLLEVERRGLALRQGYGSLWDYVNRGLGYSESGASERVSAMRLLKRAPEARQMLKAQTLTLTVAAKLQHFVRAVEKTRDLAEGETQELLSQVCGRSKKEVEKILLSKSPEAAIPKERTREITPKHTELRLVFDEVTMALLEEAKALLGASSQTETIRRALKALVEKRKHELERKAVPKKSLVPAQLTSRYVPAETRREQWRRSEVRCEFVSESGQRCTSRHRLQVDHITPLALGGHTKPENLRLLCAGHNLAEARAMGLPVSGG